MEFFATSNGIPVHISDTKSGKETILLLHGYLETLYIYTELSALLSEKYRIISIDLPGHGLSGSNKEINSIGFSATVARDVLKICGVDKAFVVGHSMGGYVAQSCVKLFPEAFKGLILLNSTPYADSSEKKADRLREIELVQSSKLNRLAELSIPKMYDPENLRRLDEKIIETVEICETHDPNGIVACLRGMMEREDNQEFLASLKIPALFIFGDKDKFISIEAAQSIIKKFPAIEPAIIEHCGHNSFVEQPEKVAAVLEAFVEKYA